MVYKLHGNYYFFSKFHLHYFNPTKRKTTKYR